MKFKAYLYEEADLCIICVEKSEKPLLETINNKENLVINIKDKNIENIYDFFRDNTIKALLEEREEVISIDFSEISDKEFYSEYSFTKLIELINSLVEASNDAIAKCNKLDEEDNDTSINSD